MPRPSLRSRSFRRIKKKIPGGASIIHYIKRNPSKARCSNCNKELHGVANLRASAMKRIPGSRKKVSRAFGGKLCAACTREEMKARARG